jgi:hypothetical protein
MKAIVSMQRALALLKKADAPIRERFWNKHANPKQLD